MLIPKKNRIAIYKHLYTEGVMCAKDAKNAPKHHELDLPNLHVMKLMESLTSRDLVKKQYSWRWYYWYLTNEGVIYLREYLGTLPENVVPKTHVKQAARPQAPRPGGFGDRPDRGFGGGRGRFEGGGRGGGFGRDGREGYRSGPREGGFGRGKEGGAPADARPEFRGQGGFGGRGGAGRGQ
mmetsp:Transcript_96475/g.133739  ORF Transcript_96475/g.133739 Transcript_96475/m.133739 type:complete len:181 (-) Transcript_96475:73-615(-)